MSCRVHNITNNGVAGGFDIKLKYHLILREWGYDYRLMYHVQPEHTRESSMEKPKDFRVCSVWREYRIIMGFF